MPTTSVLRLISPLTRLSGLVECSLARCAGGHYVDPKLAGPDSETPIECATQGGFGLIADLGGDLRDWVACGCEPPAGESEPKLGQESERSNPCYSVKRPDESGSRRSCPRGEFVERPFVRWIAQHCDHCLRRGTFAQQG